MPDVPLAAHLYSGERVLLNLSWGCISSGTPGAGGERFKRAARQF